jgi:hypothetical protein
MALNSVSLTETRRNPIAEQGNSRDRDRSMQWLGILQNAELEA